MKIIICGVGGQGSLMLAELILLAASGQDVKMSSNKGLAQRFGSIQCYMKVGEKDRSPMIKPGDADLIIALEPLEALRATSWASSKTKFLVDSNPYLIFGKKYPSIKSIEETLKSFSKDVNIINGTDRVRKAAQSIVPLNVYMFAYACSSGLLPFDKKIAMDAFNQKVKYFITPNKKAFEAGWGDG